MKLQILSDIHLEFGPFSPSETDAEIVILAGDIATGTKGIAWAKEHFKDKVVIYIVGNHEYYHHAYPKLLKKLKLEAEDSNVLVLENEEKIINGIRFLGCTLWSDFDLNGNFMIGEFMAQQHMNDFRLIRNSPGYSKFKAMNALSIHRSSKHWLEKSLETSSEKTVVITHHAPSRKSIPDQYKNSQLNPAFASNLEELIMKHQPDLWIHGHMHSSSDYYIGNTRVIANPKGYPHETNFCFSPEMVIEI